MFWWSNEVKRLDLLALGFGLYLLKIMLVSMNRNLQPPLEWFPAECVKQREWKLAPPNLRLWFKYFVVLVTNGQRMERDWGVDWCSISSNEDCDHRWGQDEECSLVHKEPYLLAQISSHHNRLINWMVIKIMKSQIQLFKWVSSTGWLDAWTWRLSGPKKLFHVLWVSKKTFL